MIQPSADGSESYVEILGRGRLFSETEPTCIPIEIGRESADRWKIEWKGAPLKATSVTDARWLNTPHGPLLAGTFEIDDGGRETVVAGIWTAQESDRHPMRKPPPRGRLPVGDETIEMSARFWRAEDGLATNTVRCLVQTSDGMIWFGTTDGLSRFDGTTWKTYTTENTPSLSDDSIRSLLEDQNGRLVVGTEVGGIFYLEGDSFRPLPGNDRLRGKESNGLREAADGSLWIALGGRELARFDRSGLLDIWPLEEFDHLRSIGQGKPYVLGWIVPLEDGRALVTSNRGPRLFDPNTDLLAYFPSLFRSVPHMLVRLADGTLCAALGTEIVLSADGFVTLDRFTIPPDCRHLRRVSPRESGGAWIGAQRGLLLLDDQALTRVEAKIPDSFLGGVVGIVEDHQGNLWLASAQDGVARLQPRFIEMSVGKESHSSIPWQPLTVAAGPDGSVAVATRSAVELLGSDGTKTYQLEPDYEFCHRTVAFSPEDPDLVLAGVAPVPGRPTVPPGPPRPFPVLAEFSSDGARPITTPEFPAGFPNVLSMAMDSDGGVWVGSSEGVYLWLGAEERWRDWNAQHGLPPFEALVVFRDRQDRCWVGGEATGLYRQNGGTLQHFTTARDGLVSDTVLCVAEDAQGTIWIGSDKGLSRITGDQVTAFAGEGVLAMSIHAIVEDGRGRLWMGTSRGLYVAEIDALERLHAGELSELPVARLGRLDGMSNETISTGYFPAACRAADGDLYFCMEGAVARIDPDQLETCTGPPVAVERISGAETFYEGRSGPPDADGGALAFPPTAQDLVRIDYGAVCFSHPEKLRYEYRLLGSSDQWRKVGAQRQAWFASLRPGEYSFEVKAYDYRDQASPRLATIPFTIRPHLYQTWQFQLGLVMAVGALVYGGHRFRLAFRMRIGELERKLEIEEERSRIARDMHDEIGTSLAQIRMLGELAKRAENGGSTGQKAGRISALANECSQSLREIIWSLNPERSSFEDLAEYLQHQVETAFAETPIRPCVTIEDGALDEREFSPVTKRQIALILRGIVSNVLKHAHASRFDLRVAAEGGHVILKARDNGVGFAPEEIAPDALGLQALQSRAESLGGSFQLSTTPGAGTSIALKFPLAESERPGRTTP